MKLVGIFSLASGALLDYAKGNKHQHELTLLHRLLDHFKPRDLALADRGFSNYVLIAYNLIRALMSHASGGPGGRRLNRSRRRQQMFRDRIPAGITLNNPLRSAMLPPREKANSYE